jgi:hypothetical protein
MRTGTSVALVGGGVLPLETAYHSEKLGKLGFPVLAKAAHGACSYFGGKRIVICTRAQVVPSLWILRFQVAKDKGNFRHMRGPRSGIDKFKESSLNHWVRMAEVSKIVQINIPSYTWFAALEANSRAGHRM